MVNLCVLHDILMALIPYEKRGEFIEMVLSGVINWDALVLPENLNDALEIWDILKINVFV